MVDSSARNKVFVYQIRKRFSLPLDLSNEECFIVYNKQLEYHNLVVREMTKCLKDLQNKNQLYEFGIHLELSKIVSNYTYIYELSRKEIEHFTILKKPKVIKTYNSIIDEYKKWLKKDEHNIKEIRIENIRKRINDYFNSNNRIEHNRKA